MNIPVFMKLTELSSYAYGTGKPKWPERLARVADAKRRSPDPSSDPLVTKLFGLKGRKNG